MKIFQITIGLLFLFFQSGYAQITLQEKNSLIHQYLGQSNEAKIKSLDKIVDYYLRNNLDSAHFFNQILYDEAIRVDTKQALATFYNNAGLLAFKNNQTPKAIDFMEKAINLSEKENDLKNLADYYKNLAGIYFQTDNYNKAITYTFKSYKIYEQIGNKKGVVVSLDHLGMLQKTVGNYKKAMEYHQKALLYALKEKINHKLPAIYHNIGVVYKRRNMPDSSMYYYNKSEKLYKNIHSDEALSDLYFDKANLFAYYYKNIDSAKIYYQKILNNNKIYSQNERVFDQLGKLYALLKDYPKSNHYLYKALTISQKKNDWHGLQYAHFYLYRNYKNQKKWDSAIFHLENFIDYQDSLKERQAKIKITDLESKYENEKKQFQIEKLQLKQHKDKQIKRLLIGGVILLLLSLLFIWRSFYLRRKRNQLQNSLLKIEKEKISQELQHKTRELTSQALMMLQKNKLLEDILQSLTAIKNTGSETHKEILNLKRRLKRSMQSDKDWELFRQYFEEINKNFFKKLKEINPKITSAEMKLAALIKLRFSIKESAALLNISEGSVKTARYQLRKKLGLQRADNIYDFLNSF